MRGLVQGCGTWTDFARSLYGDCVQKAHFVEHGVLVVTLLGAIQGVSIRLPQSARYATDLDEVRMRFLSVLKVLTS